MKEVYFTAGNMWVFSFIIFSSENFQINYYILCFFFYF